MRAHALSIEAPGAMDIVGTGGDGSGTFNISTIAAFVVAGCRVKIAKHGNRAASGTCGSADVLEALGVKIELEPKQAQTLFDTAGIVFLFAPRFHPAMKNVVAVRKELKIRTIFNVLGPFTNPAGTKRQLVGVPNSAIARTMAEAAKGLGYEHLLIVTSEDGMDEISLSAKTYAIEVRGTEMKERTIDPTKHGFHKIKKEEILGGGKEENVAIVNEILAGKKGPKRDIVVLNSAFALVVAGRAKKVEEGILMAENSLDEGKAKAVLGRLVEESNRV
jgi:anthranilate phosphoribosyltransferase